MAREPIVNAAKLTQIFEKIEGRIEPAADPKLGRYLVELVRSDEEFKRYRANPGRALTAKGINPRHVKHEVLTKVVTSVLERLRRLGRVPGDVLDSYTQTETSSHQESNFDHSASWFFNKDGWNVMHEAGHSSEESTGSQVGQDHKFDGIGLMDPGEIIRFQVNELFFPAQPLVTPKLVEEIKNAAKEIGQ